MDRRIKKQANESLSRFRNDEFLKRMKAKQKEKAKEKKNLISICLSLASTFVIVAAALVCAILIKPASALPPDDARPEVKPEKHYMLENLRVHTADLTELNASLNYLTFVGEEENITVERCVDSVYEETLYYHVVYVIDEGLSYMDFIVVVNPDYKKEETAPYSESATVASFPLRYAENCEEDEDIYFFTENGLIETDKEKLFINAEIVAFENDSGFVLLLENAIKSK